MVQAQNDPVNENLALQREIELLKTQNQITWSLLIEIVRRLQASSTSIKAAVSSLLSYDIFWDVANQHEFLKTIETSADQASALEMLLSLAFRLEAERLELKPEPHSLQEILSSVDTQIQNQFPALKINLKMPLDGKLVLVDYEYLSLTLALLIQLLLFDSNQMQIKLHAQETYENWVVEFSDLNAQMVKYIQEKIGGHVWSVLPDRAYDPDVALRMRVVCKLFDLQGLRISALSGANAENHLAIIIPAIQDV